MSYRNSALPIPAKKLQTPGYVQNGSTAWKWVKVVSTVTNLIKSNQEQIATHIFSNLVTNVAFLQF